MKYYLLFFFFVIKAASAALPDEISTYADDINKPGETGLELHVNTTLEGRKTPNYPGDIPTNHGLRMMPELSYGISSDLEGGFYLPAVRSGAGDYYIAGARARLKWLPVRNKEGGDGVFFGMNGEISRISNRFSENLNNFELRFIGGTRQGPWVFSANPTLNFALSSNKHTPDASISMKALKSLSGDWRTGVEYYSEVGKTSAIQPFDRQSNTVYAVVEYKGMHFGIGRGVTSPSDKWIIKTIFELLP